MKNNIKKITRNTVNRNANAAMCSPGPCTIPVTKVEMVSCVPDDANPNDWGYCGPDFPDD